VSNRSNSVQSQPVVSDDRIRDTLRRELDRAINIERTFTRAGLSLESGVNVHTIDAIMSRDPAKQRRVRMADAWSLSMVLGGRAVNLLLALIGYGGAKPLDEADEMHPMVLAAAAMAHLSTIATAASDGRIDHTEEPLCREAADMLIATVMPLSTAGRAA
jgi:hypothetical protein